jgi:hypothetical protein
MSAMPFKYNFIAPIPGKAGIDTRDYTPPAYPDRPGKYAAFFYANSMKYGHIYYQYIREAVNEHFPDGENMKIILKKSCTEFERDHPKTQTEFWQHMKPEEKELEQRLTDIFHVDTGASVQPDWVRNRTILRWIKHARVCGDLSGNEMIGDLNFELVRAVTYHDGIQDPDERKEVPASDETQTLNSGGLIENGSGSNSNPTEPDDGLK